MSMKVVPTAAVLGAEIAGVDLSRPLDDATFAAIERAYDEYGVIFFRGQSITPAQQVAFTRRFGEIAFNIFGERWSVPGHPEIVVLSAASRVPRRFARAGEAAGRKGVERDSRYRPLVKFPSASWRVSNTRADTSRFSSSFPSLIRRKPLLVNRE